MRCASRHDYGRSLFIGVLIVAPVLRNNASVFILFCGCTALAAIKV
jgi:hypothetical protein